MLQPNEKSRKNGKPWFVLDMRRFVAVLAEAKERGLDDCDHQGKTLWRNSSSVIVAKTDACQSEDQARMLASNGKTWAELARRKRLGEKRSSLYFDRGRFACVELAVLRVMYEQSVIEWNARLIRDRLYRVQGDAVLPKLCTSYRPPQAETGTHGAAGPPQFGQASVQLEPPVPSKPAPTCRYMIVDQEELDELRFLRDTEQRAELVSLTDCQLLALSVCSQTFEAPSPLKAKEKYLFKVHPDLTELPMGRFEAIAQSLYDRAIASLALLPRRVTRETLLRELRRRGNEARTLEELDPAMEVGEDPAGLVHALPGDAAPREAAASAATSPVAYPPSSDEATTESKQLCLLPPEIMERTNPRPYRGPPRPYRRAETLRPAQQCLKFPLTEDDWRFIT